MKPGEFSLEQNYPNPFNPNTVISCQLPVNSYVSLNVYDVLGREVVVLVNEQKGPGSYTAEFDGAKHSSGIYFFKLTTNQFSFVRKMILMK